MLIELPQEWSRAEPESGEFAFQNERVHWVGLCAQRKGQPEAVGVGLGADPEIARIRAQGELIERVCVIDLHSGRPSGGSAPSWRWSLSNGVAAHLTWAQAMQSAAFELIERDLVLRSWWTRDKVASRSPLPATLAPFTVVLGSREISPWGVLRAVMTVMIENGRPYFGFGCSNDVDGAGEHARREMTQRWFFLNEDQGESDLGKFSVGPELHMMAYHSAEGAQRILDWALWAQENAHLLQWPALPLSKFEFQDLTPFSGRGRYAVAQARCENLLQLYFGREIPNAGSWKELSSRLDQGISSIHPVG